jgi:predicted RecA/RadA family phage recombinase
MSLNQVKAIYLNSNGVYAPAGSGDEIVAGAFSGDGSALTNLNASNLSSGTVPDAQFPATLPAVSGANLTSLNASNLSSGTVPDGRFPATLPAVSGANLTSLNASNLGSGTVPDSRFPATLPAVSGANLTSLNASNLSSGTVPDGRFPATLPAVSGANLTNLSADALVSGTVPDGRFPGTLPAISGVNLIDLNASNLASGTVDTARISGNYTGITGVGTIATGTWQGSAISDTYLSTISTAGKVSDSALSSNVALLNRNNQQFTGTSPSFTHELSVPSPTADGNAATKGYVDTAVANAVAGIDYKQESEWYTDISSIPSPPGASVATFLSIINGTSGLFPAQTGHFHAGDYILLICGTSEDGQYVFAGSDTGGAGGTPNWTLSRASDMPAGSNATGAYTYCFSKIVIGMSGITYPAYNSAMICTNLAPNNTVGTDALTFVVYGVAPTYTASAPITLVGTQIGLNIGAGLYNASNYLAVQVDGSTIELNGSNEVAFKSLPSGFKINGSATSSTDVTATNLNTLVAGPTSDASLLHSHPAPIFVLPNTGSALTTGKAVTFDGTTLSYATNDGAGSVAGIVVNDPGAGSVRVANAGEVAIVSPSGSPSAGANLYILSNGTIGDFSSILSGKYVTKVGRFLGNIGPGSAAMMSVQIQEFGIKP